MLRYVKICPRCGAANDEFAESCSRDGEFLGLVPATVAGSSPTPVTEPPHADLRQEPDADAGDSFRMDGPARRLDFALEDPRAMESCQRLYLELCESGQCYEVRSGNVLGQAHPTGDADLQVRDVAGANYIHRRHCTFVFRDGQWLVTPLFQPEYTNPTYVNQQRVPPGQSAELKDGDRLTLASVGISVRIVEMP